MKIFNKYYRYLFEKRLLEKYDEENQIYTHEEPEDNSLQETPAEINQKEELEVDTDDKDIIILKNPKVIELNTKLMKDFKPSEVIYL